MTTWSRPPATRAAAVATAALACLALGLTTALPTASAGSDQSGAAHAKPTKPKKDKHGDQGKDRNKNRVGKDVRFATFNASLNRTTAGQLLTDLSSGSNVQARNVAETIQRSAPDVLLVNEFDYYPGGQAAELFRDNYLAVSQHGAPAADYPYYYVAPSNTGVPSGFDLDNDGVVSAPGTLRYGNDAFGFGDFVGQYGMVVYSKYPIATDDVRTFQRFLWKDMPGALLPDDPATPEPADWYSPEELAVFRLSSKSHWDVPIELAKNKTVHFLVSHPTPPTFDGAEDRNGLRNHDEIRFWADYIGNQPTASYLYDDEGVAGGLHRGAKFVIAGDQNADPVDGDSVDDAILQLLDHPRIDTRRAPTSEGAVEAAALQAGANLTHAGLVEQDTADFNDNPAPGNLRVDYVLPRKGLKVLASEVFWPVKADPYYYLTGTFPFPTSDHRLVWVDVKLNHRH
ncbi:MAG: endonuclease/exonuclease/phosphatase family protein [Nocardioides sp.]